MKKLLIVLPIILLISTGCIKTSEQNQNVSPETKENSTNTTQVVAEDKNNGTGEQFDWLQQALDEKILIKHSDFAVRSLTQNIDINLDKKEIFKQIKNFINTNASTLKIESVSNASIDKMYTLENGYPLIMPTVTGDMEIISEQQKRPITKDLQLYLDKTGSLFLIGITDYNYKKFYETKNQSDLYKFTGYQWDTKAVNDFQKFQSIEFKFTEPIIGNEVSSYAWGNNKCQEEFGDEWLWADYHYSDGELSKGSYKDTAKPENAWVSITSQTWECFEKGNGAIGSAFNMPEKYGSGMVVKFDYQEKNKTIIGWWGEKGEKFSQHGQYLYKKCEEKLPLLCIKSSDKGSDSIYSKHDSMTKFLVDSDNDGLIDEYEINNYHTDPNNPDTDGDGYKDGEEVGHGHDPLKK